MNIRSTLILVALVLVIVWLVVVLFGPVSIG